MATRLQSTALTSLNPTQVADVDEPSSEVMDATAEIIFNDLDRSKDGKISVYEFHNNAGGYSRNCLAVTELLVPNLLFSLLL